MIETGPINANGVYTLNGGRATSRDRGTVVIINPDGGHTYTLGIIAEDGSTFVAYSDGVITGSAHVQHGKGALLAMQVAGVSGGDDLLIGYSG